MQAPAFLFRLFAALSLCLLPAAAGAQLVPGKDYRLINPAQPTESGAKIEVSEFFWYGCPHCNALQPPLQAWLKKKPADVEFRRIPAVFQDSWVPLTRAYYALEAMALADKLHYEVFNAVHVQRLRLQDPKTLFDWVAGKGVDRQKFADTYASFAVSGRTQRSIDLTRSYDIPGTPAIVVDGRYLTAPSMTVKPDGSVDYDRYFQVLDQVIALARKNRGSKPS
jgi:thiol:disulfide interchange protein DsbA